VIALQRRWLRAIFIVVGVVVVAFWASAKSPFCELISVPIGIYKCTERTVSASPQTLIRETTAGDIYRFFIFNVLDRKWIASDRNLKSESERSAWIYNGIIRACFHKPAKLARFHGGIQHQFRKGIPSGNWERRRFDNCGPETMSKCSCWLSSDILDKNTNLEGICQVGGVGKFKSYRCDPSSRGCFRKISGFISGVSEASGIYRASSHLIGLPA
jgi:hypothetical protein